LANVTPKRRQSPFVLRARGLNIVVSVDQYRWTAATGAAPFAVDDRVPLRREDAHAREPDLRKLPRQPARATPDVVAARGVAASAGVSNDLLELGGEAPLVPSDDCLDWHDRGHHGSAARYVRGPRPPRHLAREVLTFKPLIADARPRQAAHHKRHAATGR